ncbi:hypothetical protein, partial [Undibacterium rugosum]|uniref:hypothetical protein n=1 Tax=Undibacterium rugosum TaxID=2762291 RepID=UPI001C9B3208
IGKATIATIQPHRRTTATQLEACSIISIIHIRTGQPVMTGRLRLALRLVEAIKMTHDYH